MCQLAYVSLGYQMFILVQQGTKKTYFPFKKAVTILY